jgi:hypothetical protein
MAVLHVLLALVSGCARTLSSPSAPSVAQAAIKSPALSDKPIYQASERELDAYLRQLHAAEPDFRRRIVTIARKNLGQPYEIYLLGEAPFETIDDQPVYCLGKSDCVVFAEHTIAMAMSDSFAQFLSVLQRIRYNGGRIGVLTRNHYTEADWNKNNSWLAREITDELGGPLVVRFTQRVDRAKFFKERYKLDEPIPVQTISESFIPYERIDSVNGLLRDGDIVNFVSGTSKDGGNYWVGHVGLVALMPEGSVHIIHSSKPAVREEPIEAYIERMTKNASQSDAAGKARFRGFKFLRIADDPWANLRAIDGPAAPRIIVPSGSPLTWEQFVSNQMRL